MIHHIWTVLCTKSITNADTNAVSLLEIPEELVIYTEPNQELEPRVLPLGYDLVSYWERRNEDQSGVGLVKLSLVLPHGDIRPQGEYKIDLEPYERTRIIIRIPVLIVDRAGVYRFLLELQNNDEWVEVASIPLEITLDTELDSDELEED